MALTLVEASKGERNPLRAGVIEVFAKSSPVLSRIPLQNIVGNAYSYVKEGELPGIGFRGINEAYSESAGVLNPETESMKIAGGDVDVDTALVQTRPNQSIGNLRALHTRMKVKALAAFITKNFFKGSATTDPRAFDGLQTRITTGTQLIAQGNAAGGDALTLAKLDELLDAVDGADVLYMNKTLRRKVSALVRAAGQAYEIVSDAFGRQLLAYAGVPIEVVEEDETGTDILPFSEANPGGGDSVGSSIYAVKFGEDEYVSLLQVEPGIMVRDLGELQTKPAYRTRIEWLISTAVFNGRGVARLWGVKNA